jgi:hypothetical protein
MSYCLYKHMSRSIVTCPQPNQSFYFYLTFYPSFLGFSSFYRLDLVSSTSTPWVAVVLAYLSSRRRLAGGEASSSSAGGAPHCRRSRQNRTIRFTKPDSCPVFPVSSRSFRLMSDSCGNRCQSCASCAFAWWKVPPCLCLVEGGRWRGGWLAETRVELLGLVGWNGAFGTGWLRIDFCLY